MEQLHRHQPQRYRPTRNSLRIGHGAGADGDEAASVSIVWGANVDDHEVAGMTIDEVRQELRQVFNIAPDADVVVNGVGATGDTVLRAGDSLEFVRVGGEKGGV